MTKATSTAQDSSIPVIAAKRLERLLARDARIGIIGLGYVGLPLSLLFAEAGFRVTGFDIDEKKIADLEDGRSYIFRIPATEIEAARSKGFSATSDFANLVQQDAIILCVPTPLNAHHEPDLSYIKDTARAVAPWIQPGQLLILESTTYPGTTEDVLIPLLEAGARDGLKVQTAGTPAEEGVFYVAFSPEREDPGNTQIARSQIPKVVGGHEPIAAKLAAALYGGIVSRAVCVSSTRVAEMTKLLENIYRCVNIALVNELKILCMRMDIDIWEVIDAASTKPFGFHPFYPGPGLGGHCIPIDPFYLSWKAKEYDFRTRFIELAGEINEARPSTARACSSSACPTSAISTTFASRPRSPSSSSCAAKAPTSHTTIPIIQPLVEDVTITSTWSQRLSINSKNSIASSSPPTTPTTTTLTSSAAPS